MSKVIHLSDDAHNKAKRYCKEHGLKMSDWVAQLIDGAVTGQRAPAAPPPVAAVPADDNVRALVQKKKILEAYDDTPPSTDEALPIYASPPFWAKAGH